LTFDRGLELSREHAADKDHDDTQNVWSNFDIPAEMMETA
jgi:hypothetical protein